MKKLLLITLAWTSLSLCEEPTTINALNTTIEQSNFEDFKGAFEEAELTKNELADMLHLAQLTTKLRKDGTQTTHLYHDSFSFFVTCLAHCSLMNTLRHILYPREQYDKKQIFINAALTATGLYLIKRYSTNTFKEAKDKLKEARYIEAYLIKVSS